MSEKGFSIFDTQKKFWFKVDRTVRNMNVVSVVEPVFNHNVATQFPTEESAKRMITEIDKEGNYDVSNVNIINIDEYEEQKRKEEEAKEKEIIKQAWENTPEEDKKKLLEKTIESGKAEEFKKFLEASGIDITNLE